MGGEHIRENVTIYARDTPSLIANATTATGATSTTSTSSSSSPLLLALIVLIPALLIIAGIFKRWMKHRAMERTLEEARSRNGNVHANAAPTIYYLNAPQQMQPHLEPKATPITRDLTHPMKSDEKTEKAEVTVETQAHVTTSDASSEAHQQQLSYYQWPLPQQLVCPPASHPRNGQAAPVRQVRRWFS